MNVHSRAAPPPATTTTPRAAGTTYAVIGDSVVHVADGIGCPFCGRRLQATDVKVEAGEVNFICRGDGCHRDILRIRPAS